VSWLRQCADWLAHLDADSYPPVVSLGPVADWPTGPSWPSTRPGCGRSLDRIAADVDELARARRAQGPDHRRSAARPAGGTPLAATEPDLEFRAFCTRRRLPARQPPQLERAWDTWHAERSQRGEISQRPAYAGQPVPATLTTTR